MKKLYAVLLTILLIGIVSASVLAISVNTPYVYDPQKRRTATEGIKGGDWGNVPAFTAEVDKDARTETFFPSASRPSANVKGVVKYQVKGVSSEVVSGMTKPFAFPPVAVNAAPRMGVYHSGPSANLLAKPKKVSTKYVSGTVMGQRGPVLCCTPRLLYMNNAISYGICRDNVPVEVLNTACKVGDVWNIGNKGFCATTEKMPCPKPSTI